MKLTIDTNIAEVQAALKQMPDQFNYTMMTALNTSAAQAKSEVVVEMQKVFDRPTPWVLNSMRIKLATKTELGAALAFKDKAKDRTEGGEAARSMIEPHVYGGKRRFVGMEVRLMRAGYLPAGWNVVPGEGAKLDAYGNINRGQVSTILNILGTYREAGYSKANAATVKRLAKGSVKKNVYGIVYWFNPVGNSRNPHLPPGVYQRVTTAFGSSLKPVLVFVKRANYQPNFNFYGVASKSFETHFPSYFDAAFKQAMRTASLKDQGGLF